MEAYLEELVAGWELPAEPKSLLVRSEEGQKALPHAALLDAHTPPPTVLARPLAVAAKEATVRVPIYMNDCGAQSVGVYTLSAGEARALLSGIVPEDLEPGKLMARATFLVEGREYTYLVVSPRGSPSHEKGRLQLRALRKLMCGYTGCHGRGKQQYILRTREGEPADFEDWSENWFWDFIGAIYQAR